MKRQKVKGLTDAQMHYIDHNWKLKTHQQMGEHLKINENTVSWYCSKNGYRKGPPPKTEPTTKKKVYRNKGPERKPVNRPPADHTNLSWEQHVNRWINVHI